MLSPRLSRVVLMVRGTEGVAAAANFYHKALGLALHRVTDDWAELAIGNEDLTLHVQATYGEGQLSTGYSPVLTFEVANMDHTIAACAQAGGTKKRVYYCTCMLWAATRFLLICFRFHLDSASGWTYTIPCLWQSCCYAGSRRTHDWFI